MRIMNNLKQGTLEWLQLRVGMPSASQFKNIMTSDGKRSKTYTKYRQQNIHAPDNSGNRQHRRPGVRAISQSKHYRSKGDDMKIEIEVSDINEATASPWWMILDPKQNMTCDVYHLASQITGPFFSREEGELILKQRRHHYSDRARVFCASGCYTHQYDDACRGRR